MRFFIFMAFILSSFVSYGQVVPPPYNGQPDIRMDTGKQSTALKPWEYYWTIWFKLSKPSKEFIAHYDSVKCIACDSLEYRPHEEWVQSVDDSLGAYEYYRHLRHDGKVTMWRKYECEVDTTSVYIDKYVVPLHNYIGIKQPS